MNRIARVTTAATSLVVFSVMLSGCETNLLAERVSGTGPVAGDPYQLYYDWFDITVNYQLANCEEGLEIKVSAEAEANRSPDPEHDYVIDTTDLSSPLKTAEAVIKYHSSGMVSSLNATADDKSVEIAASVLKAAIGVAKLAAGGGGVSVAENEPLKYTYCNSDTAKALMAYDAKKGKLKEALVAHGKASDAFDIWKAKVDAMGPAVDQQVAKQFKLAYIAFQKATETLTTEKAALKKLSEPLIYTAKKTWPENGNSFTGSLPINSEVYQTNFVKKWGTDKPGAFDSSPANREKLTVNFRIKSRNPGAAIPTAPDNDDYLKLGIPYRSAQLGRLRISQVAAKGEEAEPLFEKDYPILQLGRIHLKSCKSKKLTSSGCSLAFNENGQLIESGSKVTKTAGQSMSSMANDAVDQYSAYKTYRDGEPVRDLEAEAKLLELQGKIASAKNALANKPPPTQTQLLNDEIALLDAERKLIEARLALDKARASITP